MTAKFKKFPSIVQFANAVKAARDHANYHHKPLGKIMFSGSVKLHGTNAGIGTDPSVSEVWAQSRENILTYDQDNAGFAAWVIRTGNEWNQILQVLSGNIKNPYDNLYVFGEWFGSSIQKGVAISNVKEKHFGIFQIVAVKTNFEEAMDETGAEYMKEVQVHEFLDPVPFAGMIQHLIPNVIVIDAVVPPVMLEIDMSAPHLVQNKLLELTLAVEEKCPVGASFGFEGTGEGLVWTAQGVDYLPKFKTKGEKHSATKVKVVRELTEAEIASKANAAEFVDYACTDNRMEQGIQKLIEAGQPIEPKSMGAYLKWLGNDILTECGDVLAKSGIERKDVMPNVAQKGKDFFFAYIDKINGLEHKSTWVAE